MVGGRVLLVMLLASAGVVGCDGSSSGPTEAPAPLDSYGRAGPPPPLPPRSASGSASASADAAVAVAPVVQHHVSLAAVLLKAAFELPLNGEQRTALQQAEANLYPAGAPSPWTAVRTFQADLVAGIRVNKLDTAKLKADGADIDKAVAAGQAAEAAELDALHELLDQGTRQSLVDRVKARRGRFERPDAPKPQPGGPDGGTVDPTRRRLEALTATLGLDDVQQRQVAALLVRQAAATSPAVEQAHREAMRKRIDALLAAFPQEAFQAEKLDLSGPSGRSPHERLDEAATFAAGMLPILKVGQLFLFADQTEKGGGRPERFVEDVEPGPPRPLALP